ALAICSGVARGPTHLAAGSDGITRVRKKVMKATPNITMTPKSNRLRMNFFIQAPYKSPPSGFPPFSPTPATLQPDWKAKMEGIERMYYCKYISWKNITV